MKLTARMALPLLVIALIAAGCGGDDDGATTAATTAAATTSAAPATTEAATSEAATSEAATSEAATTDAATSEPATTEAATTAAGTEAAVDSAAVIKQALASQGIDVTDEQIACITDSAGADLAAQLAAGGASPQLIVAIVRCAGDAFAAQIEPSIKEDPALAGITDEQAACLARVSVEALTSLSDEELLAAITGGTSEAPDDVKDAIVEQGASECGLDAEKLRTSLTNNPA